MSFSKFSLLAERWVCKKKQRRSVLVKLNSNSFFYLHTGKNDKYSKSGIVLDHMRFAGRLKDQPPAGDIFTRYSGWEDTLEVSIFFLQYLADRAENC
jgi:hypothetical protein